MDKTKNAGSTLGNYGSRMTDLRGLTFNNFLRVVEEEFTEWWSFGPFECVQQLLDLGGHPAADRHAWTNTNSRH